MSQNGKETADGAGRICDMHGEHARLYPCPSYTPEVLEGIRIESEQLEANLRDPAWCERQIANGLPPIGIAIFRAFAGIEPERR